MRIEIPDDLVERLDEESVPSWHARDSAEARGYGDRWLAEGRSVALVVPALPARPVGRVVMINAGHPDAGRVRRGAAFAVPWDERLF